MNTLTTVPHPAQRWVIALVQPAGYVHSGALWEAAEGIRLALNALGKEARFGNFNEPCDALLVFGAHLLPENFPLPAHTVLYNLEQLVDPFWRQNPQNQAYLKCLQQHRVWDYSSSNVAFLASQGHTGATHIPLGYVPELAQVPALPVEDIDVLFYGSLNPRRQQVLDALRARGLKVEHLFGVYGEARDAVIARAKVVLNVHFYAAKLFEIARVSYLLTNGKAVVCEDSVMDAEDEFLRDGMVYVPYEGLVDACVALVGDEQRRRHLARQGHAVFSSRRQVDTLAAALGLPPPAAPVTGLPAVLHLGSGKDYQPDALNMDIDPYWQPDLVLDFGQPVPWGQALPSGRFGTVTLAENQFDRIIANDVLEHIPDLVCAMTNALTLLRPGGEFHISVPYDLSLGAWQDPTHVRAFNENSWLYYTDWFWYLNWGRARFDMVKSNMTLSAMGQQLMTQPAARNNMAAVMRTPRAVDSLQVVLRKRYLTVSEQQHYAARRTVPPRPAAAARA
ncbi:MAG: methyltransferase domain-containing protein [Acidovorax sp.]